MLDGQRDIFEHKIVERVFMSRRRGQAHAGTENFLHDRICVLVLQPEEVYLNLVLEFVPETIYRIIKHYSRTKRQVPALYVKVAAYPSSPTRPLFNAPAPPHHTRLLQFYSLPPPCCATAC